MLLIQFTTMVIDRALYLRKTVLGKLIFQVILVFSIHLWMFFILPAVTERYRASPGGCQGTAWSLSGPWGGTVVSPSPAWLWRWPEG